MRSASDCYFGRRYCNSLSSSTKISLPSGDCWGLTSYAGGYGFAGMFAYSLGAGSFEMSSCRSINWRFCTGGYYLRRGATLCSVLLPQKYLHSSGLYPTLTSFGTSEDALDIVKRTGISFHEASHVKLGWTVAVVDNASGDWSFPRRLTAAMTMTAAYANHQRVKEKRYKCAATAET